MILAFIIATLPGAPYDCVGQLGTRCEALIPDGYDSVTTTFEVPADACAPGLTLTSVEVTFNVVHSQPRDLVLTLLHDGTELTLTDEGCCEADGWSVRLGEGPASPACPSTTGTLEALSALYGRPASGEWTLVISDTRRSHIGFLVNWGVDVSCDPPVVEPDPSPEEPPEEVPEETPEPEPEATPDDAPEPTPEPSLEPGPPSLHVHGSTACNGGGLGGLALSLLSFVSVLLLGFRARAQESVEVRYHAPVPGGDANLVNVHGADVLSHLRFSAGAYVDYAVDPLVLTIDDGVSSRDVELIADELRVDVLFALGFADVLELGVALPVVLSASGKDALGADAARDAHVGDLRVVPKWRIVGSGDFALALAVPLTLPTAGDPYSGGNVTFEPRLVGEYSPGIARILANVGYRVQPEEAALFDLDVGSELRLALGAAVEVVPALEVLGEGIVKMVADGDVPAELAIGARYGVAGHAVTALVGFGVSEGYGTPAWHLTFGYTFTQAPPAPLDPNGDEDGDGVINSADACVTKPEDKDGRDDLDGCPDHDDDGDGIADVNDGPKDERGFGACKDIAEDEDGFEDRDGCLDPDNDEDGILDVADKCPNAAEVMNQYQDEDGCPDVKRAAIAETGIDLYETVLFETGKDNLLPASDELLDQVAGILREHPEILKLEVAGHTDEIAGQDFNQRLSEKRANRVRDFLIGKGIAPERLVAKGYGERQPLTKDTTPEALQKNRRVEFRILDKRK